MHKEAPFFLNQIIRDIEREKQEKISIEEQERTYLGTKEILTEKTHELLTSKGIVKSESIGTGAGRGIIGYKLETVSDYFENFMIS